jgi:protein-export membrane protein SecD
MQNTVWIRLLIVAGLIGLAGWMLTPSIIYFQLDEQQTIEVQQDSAAFKKYLPSWAPESHIVPGLDLQGGVHMVLGVDLDKAVSDRARRVSNRLRTDLEDKKIGFSSVDHLADEGKGDRVRATFASTDALATFDKDLAELYGDLAEVGRDNLTVTWRVHPDWVAKVRSDAVDQTIKTISNRIDKMHVTEPSITKRGEDQVQVQLPGFANPEEAKALIGRTAQLEFQMCDDESDFLTRLGDLPSFATLQTSGFQRSNGSFAQDMYLEFPEEQLKEMRKYFVGKVPSGLVMKYGRLPTRPGEAVKWRTYTLKAEVALTGDDLVNAQVAMGSPEQPQPYVSIEFSPTGKQLFGDLTTKNVGKRMAIVLEDVVDSAPVINEPITGGMASITMGGSRTRDEMIKDANQLALVLKAGALPAPITFREEKTVGASLGKEALDAAGKASLLGIALVFGFLIFYYRVGGLISCFAMALNMVFVLASLSWLGGTLTLPGIAGLLLTIGMADDANVLINERIREELRAGKTARSAVEAGYSSALSAILDSQITTFIAGLVLWQFGSGAIQNFATTLLIGVISSLVTGVYFTRVLFDLYILKDRDTLAV